MVGRRGDLGRTSGIDVRRDIKPRVGLVLTGGGARGAYQCGAISGICDVADRMGNCRPFDVLTGCSAGSINAAYLASQATDMVAGAQRLRRIWNNVTTQQVFRTDVTSLFRIAVDWLLQLFAGGWSEDSLPMGLLDTTPLRRLITDHVDYYKIDRYIQAGVLGSLAITAVNYGNGYSSTFYQSGGRYPPWIRARREVKETRITAEHVLASTAIPMLFPPIKSGNGYYGDGNVRNSTPLSPAIKLGADRLIVIGVRQWQGGTPPPMEYGNPSPGRVASVILNSIMLDSIETDYERLGRINHTLSLLPTEAETPLRPVQVCLIRPSEDLGAIAFEMAHHLPAPIRHLVRGLGTPKDVEDLISYLLFEAPYTQRLVALGFQDALKKEEEIRQALTR